MDYHWYVIQTKPREENRCAVELSRQGIETICPMINEYRWRRRRLETVPLFPSYIFCRFIYPKDYYSVKWAKGVSKLIQFGDSPAHLEDSIVQFFIAAMDDNGVIDQTPSLSKGDKVQFQYGPLKGLIGTILRADTAEERVLVLMEHLSFQGRLLVDKYHVKAI